MERSNLCNNIQPPPGFNYLLDLGLNFCIEQHKPTPNIENTLKRLERSIRLKAWTTENEINDEGNNYIKNLYLPSTWHPPLASTEIENSITLFSSKVRDACASNIVRPRTNLSRLQYTCLQKIKNDKHQNQGKKARQTPHCTASAARCSHGIRYIRKHNFLLIGFSIDSAARWRSFVSAKNEPVPFGAEKSSNRLLPAGPEAILLEPEPERHR